MSKRSPCESRSLTLSGRGGIRLAADAWGHPEAPPVLLLHGGGQTRHAWGGTAGALAARGWYAVSLDLRGHGESEWAPDGDYEAGTFAADLAAVASGFRHRPSLVGASLGGLCALLALGENPQLARALILVDVVPRMEPAGVDRIVSFMQARPDGFASLEEAGEAIAHYLPQRPRPVDREGLAKNLRLGVDGRWRWHWDPLFVTGRRVRISDMPERLREAARRLRLPTLLVRGRMSDLVSPEGVRDFLELAPHSQLVDVSGAGHMVAGDRNDLFTEAVIRFLGDAPSGP